MKKGKLILIPTPIGEDPRYPLLFYPGEYLFNLDVFVVEELSTARRFLKKAGYPKNFDEVEFLILNEQSSAEETSDFLQYIHSGKSVGLMSEAGLPCIADPGATAVKLAHSHQVEIVPLPGPSSIFLALMASGGNGQQFSFHGYLPIDKKARIKKVQEIERLARMTHASQIFMETPYRNHQLLHTLVNTCKDDTQLCIAVNLLSVDQYIRTHSILKWKSEAGYDFHKKPAVYVLYY
jgi:16S rRNA (cytidine1402-2'-O)-methyltransferase